MNIESILKNLIEYFERTRRVGHTTLMFNGITEMIKKEKPFFMFFYRQKDGMEELKGRNFSKSLKRFIKSLHTTDIDLRGYQYPIIFDNSVIYKLCIECLNQIEMIRTERDDIIAFSFFCDEELKKYKAINSVKINPFVKKQDKFYRLKNDEYYEVNHLKRLLTEYILSGSFQNEKMLKLESLHLERAYHQEKMKYDLLKTDFRKMKSHPWKNLFNYYKEKLKKWKKKSI